LQKSFPRGEKTMKRLLAFGLTLGLALFLALAIGSALRASARPQAFSLGPVLRAADVFTTTLSASNKLDQAAFGRGPEGITAAPTGQISYQGRLLQNGAPYSGTLSVTFRLYDLFNGGTAWWQETQTVKVQNGLFTVMLGAVSPLTLEGENFGRQQWLSIQPLGAADELLPRQPLSTVAYAYGLMPGVSIYDHNPYVGSSYYRTLFVSSDNHPAIYGGSATYEGVWGQAAYTETAGVVGMASGYNGPGVYGFAANTTSYTMTAGVVGRAETNDLIGGAGVLGVITDTAGVAVYGRNTGPGGSGTGGESVNNIGVFGLSITNTGVAGYTGRSDDNYGLFTPDNLYSKNYNLTGATMQIVQNGGSQPIEPGDVVVFSGLGLPLEADGSPIVQVSKSSQANSTAVAGVAFGAYDISMLTERPQFSNRQAPPAAVAAAQPAAPGEYLLVVIQGLAQVKVSASSGAIQPGDLLSSGEQAGVAARAVEVDVSGAKMALPGAVFGKALEMLPSGDGLIYVFVTLR
jgi:hypothetical protein